jgi:hypothetical protein
MNETEISVAVATAAESAAASAASRLGTAAELDVAAARVAGRRLIDGAGAAGAGGTENNIEFFF